MIFILTKYFLGLGNVVHFPALAAKHGGGSFLIAYIIMIVLVGFPTLLMELALGQFSRIGPLNLYGNMAPLFRGLGFGIIALATLIRIYYNVIISWFIFYFFANFQSPWSCDKEDDKCSNFTLQKLEVCAQLNALEKRIKICHIFLIRKAT